MKPGYKTTEFWLTIIFVLGNQLIASGLLAQVPTALSITTTIVSVLAALGYTGQRKSLKTERAEIDAELAVVNGPGRIAAGE